MRLATWNVNSLKVRMSRVLELLEAHRPDVLLLQETKCEAEAFPAPLAGRIERCGIDRDVRKGPKPSDHAPLLLELR